MRIVQGLFSSRKSDAGFFQLYSVSPTPNKDGKFVVKNKYGEHIQAMDDLTEAKEFVDKHNQRVHGRVGAVSGGIAGAALGSGDPVGTAIGAAIGAGGGWGFGQISGEFSNRRAKKKFDSGKNKYYGRKGE